MTFCFRMSAEPRAFSHDTPARRNKLAQIIVADYIADPQLLAWDKRLQINPGPSTTVIESDVIEQYKTGFIDYGPGGESVSELHIIEYRSAL